MSESEDSMSISGLEELVKLDRSFFNACWKFGMYAWQARATRAVLGGLILTRKDEPWRANSLRLMLHQICCNVRDAEKRTEFFDFWYEQFTNISGAIEREICWFIMRDEDDGPLSMPFEFRNSDKANSASEADLDDGSNDVGNVGRVPKNQESAWLLLNDDRHSWTSGAWIRHQNEVAVALACGVNDWIRNNQDAEPGDIASRLIRNTNRSFDYWIANEKLHDSALMFLDNLALDLVPAYLILMLINRAMALRIECKEFRKKFYEHLENTHEDCVTAGEVMRLVNGG